MKKGGRAPAPAPLAPRGTPRSPAPPRRIRLRVHLWWCDVNVVGRPSGKERLCERAPKHAPAMTRRMAWAAALSSAVARRERSSWRTAAKASSASPMFFLRSKRLRETMGPGGRCKCVVLRVLCGGELWRGEATIQTQTYLTPPAAACPAGPSLPPPRRTGARRSCRG